MTDGDGLLRQTRRGGVVTLTLDRPAQRNALSGALIARLQTCLDALAGDAEARVVVLAGSGPAFSSGHDLKEIRALASREEIERLFAACSRMMTTIGELPLPVLACVHGMATAAGCQLVAACDLAVASEDAVFATPGV